MDLPIVCNRDALAPGEPDRQKELFRELGRELQEVRELPRGFSYRFPAESLAKVAELMGIERRCCSFLELKLEVKASDPHIWLTVEGPEGAKAVVSAELQLRS
ncbi:MAG: hypothetical protein ACRD21_29030 [Vicinamibacteria bacterium]